LQNLAFEAAGEEEEAVRVAIERGWYEAGLKIEKSHLPGASAAFGADRHAFYDATCILSGDVRAGQKNIQWAGSALPAAFQGLSCAQSVGCPGASRA